MGAERRQVGAASAWFPGEVAPAHLEIARGRATSSALPLCLVTRPKSHLTLHKSLKDVQETVAARGLPGVLSCPRATSRCPTDSVAAWKNKSPLPAPAHTHVDLTHAALPLAFPVVLAASPEPSSAARGRSPHDPRHPPRCPWRAPSPPRGEDPSPSPCFLPPEHGGMGSLLFLSGTDRWECGLVAAKLTGFDVTVANR